MPEDNKKCFDALDEIVDRRARTFRVLSFVSFALFLLGIYEASSGLLITTAIQACLSANLAVSAYRCWKRWRKAITFRHDIKTSFLSNRVGPLLHALEQIEAMEED